MDSVDRPRAREVNCPACGQVCLYSPANRWRPFCSERCKKIDLGAWASDQYRIAGSDPSPADTNDDLPPRH
jgi:endogenous inhibitor of DNA gyrase (YacG/DUF329 family)